MMAGMTPPPPSTSDAQPVDDPRLSGDPGVLGGAAPASTLATSATPPSERVAERNVRGPHGRVGPNMAIDVSVVRDLTALRALEPEWHALADASPNALFRGPAWLVAWWLAFQKPLSADLHVLVGRAHEDQPTEPGSAAITKAGTLVFLAPLYRRTIKVALLDTRELRMIGDAGPRPPSLDFLVAPGWEDRAGAAIARALIDEAAQWDLLELEPLADPSRVRANMVQRLGPAGFVVESSPSAGGTTRIALALAPADATDAGVGVVTTFGDDKVALRKGMSALRRLSRLEWAERDEASPLADNEAMQLLEEVATGLAGAGRVRLARVDDTSGEAAAAALVIDDGDRAVVLAMGVDPQVPRAAQRLLHAEALAARARGCVALDIVAGVTDHALPMLPTTRQPAIALRVWGQSTTASVGRTYASVARRARRARETPAVAASQARAAWTRIRSAAANVALYDRYCLYRGQLWTRGLEAPPGLEVRALTEADFDQLDDAHRAELLEQLALDEAAVRGQWRRGDQAVLASLGVRPAGIAWAARGPIEAPELGRTLALSKYDAFIHSVFVSPAARGRAVGPVMLEHLARTLRATDAYRSWALIPADNQASLRAFQKAAFTPCCDVIHAKMATVNRVICRPPDPEALELLGLQA
jgi:GNAT superfamily N-acetyltransferase